MNSADIVTQELGRRYSKIVYTPRDYAFYLAVYEYMDFICSDEAVTKILRHESTVYRQLHRTIVESWDRTQNQSSLSNDKLYKAISENFSLQVHILESGNLYCRYLAPKGVHSAIEEERGIEKDYIGLESPAREQELNDLQEIRFGRISRKNGMVKRGAEIYYKNLLALHFGLLGRLSAEEVKESSAAQESVDIDPRILQPSIRFDKEKSILFIRGEKVPIAIQDKETNAHKLLAYLFVDRQDRSEEFFFSEIAVEAFWDKEYKGSKTAWRRYYNTCEEINEKIRKSTISKVDDFLIFSSGRTGRVRINPKYLNI